MWWGKQSSLSKKSKVGVISSALPRPQLQGQTMSLGIGLIKLIKPSDALNYELFFKHYILQAVLHVLFV